MKLKTQSGSLTKTAILCCISVASASYLEAAVLAQYSFENNATPSGVAANMTASSATYSGLTVTYTTTGFIEGTTSARFTGSDTAQNTAVNGDAINFTLTPSALYTLDLSNITWQFRANNNNQSGGQTTQTILYASTDNFATTLAASDVYTADQLTGTGGGSIMQGTLDLSSYSAFATPIQFRLVVSDFSTNANKFSIIDNIQVNGEVLAIPEPSAALLGGLGVLLLLRRRRR